MRRYVGLNDLKQHNHSIRRNFPVLGHLRYLLESIRPEIQQYFIEGDNEETPFSREMRAVVYQRAKGANDTRALGTRRDVNAEGFEWINHSMFPVAAGDVAKRVRVGGAQCAAPYDASLLNISAMSYGALSGSAVAALNRGAALGGFAHNTGEGGISRFHREGGGDIFWNIGAGYYSRAATAAVGDEAEPPPPSTVPSQARATSRAATATARTARGASTSSSSARTRGASRRATGVTRARSVPRKCSIIPRTLPSIFPPPAFALAQVKMIELKLSQGAKPSHGGILPAAKITPAIAEARGLGPAPWVDCNSPPRHSAFSTPEQLMHFLAELRDESGGKPVGFKLCVGQPAEVAALCHAMLDTGVTPDFITVDGAEGGTGAAPPEFQDSVGMPLAEGLRLVDSMLTGAGLRDRVTLIASGKVYNGFSLVRALALGADLCNSARGMMFALGCIQARKCNRGFRVGDEAQPPFSFLPPRRRSSATATTARRASRRTCPSSSRGSTCRPRRGASPTSSARPSTPRRRSSARQAAPRPTRSRPT